VALRAAEVSIDDITVPLGTLNVDVPLLISPASAEELIGAMNISFGAGEEADMIPILNTGTEFEGSIWANSEEYFGAALTPSIHTAKSAVTAINPLQIRPDGIIITYTLDTSNLPVGDYLLDPDFQVEGIGSSADTPLTFVDGTLHIGSVQVLDGDYNGNGTVEQADLDLVLLNWGDPGDPVPGGWINDLPDGNIDQAELDGVLLNWGMMAAPLAASSVPEPSAALLAIALTTAAAFLLRRPRLLFIRKVSQPTPAQS
jgi:hypothetical protein